MKLASFIVQGRSSYGVVEGDQIIDLESLKPTLGSDLKQAIGHNRLNELTTRAWQACRVSLADVTFLPVIPNPGKVLCIGINYATHVRETGQGNADLSDDLYPLRRQPDRPPATHRSPDRVPQA